MESFLCQRDVEDQAASELTSAEGRGRRRLVKNEFERDNHCVRIANKPMKEVS
jgi:hypothetical protein